MVTRHRTPCSMGRYIAIEGPEKSGKSTFTKMLEEKLIELDYSVILHKEPLRFNDEVRAILNRLLTRMLVDSCITGRKTTEILQENLAALALFMMDRMHYIKTTISPAITNVSGNIIISDRCVLSSWIYQYFLVRHLYCEIGFTKEQEDILSKTKDMLSFFTRTHGNIPHSTIILQHMPEFERPNDTEMVDTNIELNEALRHLYKEIPETIPCIGPTIIRLDQDTPYDDKSIMKLVERLNL